ncbi:MAG: DUF2630 family protein [Pseudonocardiaceae bacterium]
MDDRELIDRINTLVDEEHHLERSHIGTALSPEEEGRLETLNVQLDQCWDLLRQRRARRNAGQDPDEADPRSPGMVEGYRQ